MSHSTPRTAWIFSEQEAQYPELAAAATQVSTAIRAFAVNGVAVRGAQTVYRLAWPEGRMLEDNVPTMAALIREHTPALVVFGASRRCKAMAARLAVLLDGVTINDITALSAASGIAASRMMYGGLGLAEETSQAAVVILTVGSGVFQPVANPVEPVETVEPAFVPPATAVHCLERRPRQNSSVDIGRAKRVVSVGRGLKTCEDLALVRALADAMQAEVGCSRPIAEGEHWLERERYVGITGAMLKADVYLALGISGQIQHMAGVNGVKTLFAVNKDKNAPIFRMVDYGLVGDMYKVMPALAAYLAKRR